MCMPAVQVEGTGGHSPGRKKRSSVYWEPSGVLWTQTYPGAKGKATYENLNQPEFPSLKALVLNLPSAATF